jgi:hypothetical protein
VNEPIHDGYLYSIPTTDVIDGARWFTTYSNDTISTFQYLPRVDGVETKSEARHLPFSIINPSLRSDKEPSLEPLNQDSMLIDLLRWNRSTQPLPQLRHGGTETLR